jgi:hypothetical protein
VYFNSAFMWLAGNSLSEMVLNVNVCKDISQSMIYIFFVHFVSYIVECCGHRFKYCTYECDYRPRLITHEVGFILVLRVETTPINKYTNLYIH